MGSRAHWGLLLLVLLCRGVAFAEPVLYSAEELEAVEQELQALLEAPGSSVFAPAPAIRIEGVPLKQPTSVTQLFALAGEIASRIREAPGPTVSVEIGDETYLLDPEPIGVGGVGVVYAIVGGEFVLKLAKPNAIAIRSLLYEREFYPLIETLAQQNGFSVPRPEFMDARGVLAIKERVRAKSVSDFLLEEQIVGAVAQGSGVRISRRPLSAFSKTGREVAQQVEKLLQVRRDHPDLRLDLGPDNLFVIEKAQGTELSLVDIGPSGPATKARFDEVLSFDAYIDVACGLLQRNTDLGFRKIPLDCPSQILASPLRP